MKKYKNLNSAKIDFYFFLAKYNFLFIFYSCLRFKWNTTINRFHSFSFILDGLLSFKTFIICKN